MNVEDKYYFGQLKNAISSTFLQQNSAPAAIEDWKGEDIIAFQEDLLSRVKAKVSEKWFYTYIKNDTDKLPRIDMLTMLSKYAGYENWNHFKASHKIDVTASHKKPVFKKRYWLVLLLPVIALIIYAINLKNTFEFCFEDTYKNEAVKIPLDITILQENESPLPVKTDSSGCFTHTTKNDVITFVVQSPYHKTDTITRHIKSNNNNETIKLLEDDYALMLYYYTNGNVKDWKKRRQFLTERIAGNAEIYQLFENNIGVEVHTKEHFIGILTIPTGSLKNIEILDVLHKDGKIVKLKFMIK